MGEQFRWAGRQSTYWLHPTGYECELELSAEQILIYLLSDCQYRMAQLVASNMLSYRCAGWKEHHFPVLQNLCLQPGETPAAALQARYGWDGETAAATMIAKVDPTVGRVLATRYWTGGALWDHAGKVGGFGGYTHADPDKFATLRFAFNVRGEDVEWQAGDGAKNVATWIRLRDITGLTFSLNGNPVSKQQLTEAGFMVEDWLTRTKLR